MKKIIVIFLAAATAAACALADTWKDPATGYTWTYSINGNTAEIYNHYSVAISPSPTGTLVIPSTIGGKFITSIGGRAFYNCSGLTSVTIPDGVVSINSFAFSGCSGLTSVTIPESVKSIENYAFDGCSGLTSVTIGNGVTSIVDWAFYGCSGLTSVTIGNGVTSIGRNAFYGCTSLADVTLPDSLVSCDVEEVFRDTPFILSDTFPDFILSRSGKKLFGVKTYDKAWDWSNPPDVVIPSSVTELADFSLGVFRFRYGFFFSARIVFNGAKPEASELAFAQKWRQWDEETQTSTETNRIERSAVYYYEGESGWKWGEEWCGVKTYALDELPQEEFRGCMV